MGCTERRLDEAVSSYLVHRQRRHLSPGTILTNSLSLHRFVQFCRLHQISDPLAVTPGLIDRFVTYLTTKYRCRVGHRRHRRLAFSSVVSTLSVVRSLFAFLVREGVLLLDPCRHLVFRGHGTMLVDRAVRHHEFEAMLETIRDDGPRSLRNRALLEVLFGCGLRRGEAVGLDLYDVDLGHRQVQVRRGKGGKARVVPISGEARTALRRYIESGRPQLVTARTDAALFLATGGQRLSGMSVLSIVAQAARRAGLRRVVTPHHLRHGYATALIRGGADVSFVQKLLGHERIDTTEHYTPLAVDDLKLVHRQTHPRERRR